MAVKDHWIKVRDTNQRYVYEFKKTYEIADNKIEVWYRISQHKRKFYSSGWIIFNDGESLRLPSLVSKTLHRIQYDCIYQACSYIGGLNLLARGMGEILFRLGDINVEKR